LLDTGVVSGLPRYYASNDFLDFSKVAMQGSITRDLNSFLLMKLVLLQIFAKFQVFQWALHRRRAEHHLVVGEYVAARPLSVGKPLSQWLERLLFLEYSIRILCGYRPDLLIFLLCNACCNLAR